MELFFAHYFNPENGELEISPDEQTHIQRSLRKKEGDRIVFTDGKGRRIIAEIAAIGKRRTDFRVIEFEKMTPAEKPELEIAIAVIRPSRLDWAVEKLSELGANRITPLLCRYNSAKSVKMNHLHKITVSAIKQSNRYYLPEFCQPISWADWVDKSAGEPGINLIAHFGGEARQISAGLIGKSKKIRMAVGPEGGFHSDEIDLADRAGFVHISLGDAILRAETAAVAALSQINLFM